MTVKAQEYYEARKHAITLNNWLRLYSRFPKSEPENRWSQILGPNTHVCQAVYCRDKAISSV